jgi:hypothetical protein
MVADLLKGFVKAPWVAALDSKSLERVNGHFITRDNEKRESDIIWRLAKIR